MWFARTRHRRFTGVKLDAMLRDLRAGDPRARKQLGAWLSDHLTRYFTDGGFGTEDTKELVQRTMVDILEKLSDVPGDADAFVGWVLGFAWTEVLTIKREAPRAFRRTAKLQVVVDMRESPTGPDGSVLERERWRIVERHVQQLPPIYQQALEIYLDTGTYKALAAKEVIADGTARSRISRALRLLRESIEDARLTQSPFRTPSSAA